ncbi:hypothetical protein ELD05_09785 [Caldicellulosiruptor changbaiensis]|uniref:Uncharacterized protein n=1 Tax=Caldicellulosiruptor changbaiensis TaxID=1222016 RepID=A0A3T0D7C8_9FIRM|nr:hypothetical protein [Caldicellulosiruptor changbaiensis]AZT90909.1 hypothetical protein ELD05_09785 [Caldicellulosiruptor changbaiensis]
MYRVDIVTKKIAKAYIPEFNGKSIIGVPCSNTDERSSKVYMIYTNWDKPQKKKKNNTIFIGGYLYTFEKDKWWCFVKFSDELNLEKMENKIKIFPYFIFIRQTEKGYEVIRKLFIDTIYEVMYGLKSYFHYQQLTNDIIWITSPALKAKEFNPDDQTKTLFSLVNHKVKDMLLKWGETFLIPIEPSGLNVCSEKRTAEWFGLASAYMQDIVQCLINVFLKYVKSNRKCKYSVESCTTKTGEEVAFLIKVLDDSSNNKLIFRTEYLCREHRLEVLNNEDLQKFKNKNVKIKCNYFCYAKHSCLKFEITLKSDGNYTLQPLIRTVDNTTEFKTTLDKLIANTNRELMLEIEFAKKPEYAHKPVVFKIKDMASFEFSWNSIQKILYGKDVIPEIFATCEGAMPNDLINELLKEEIVQTIKQEEDIELVL